MKKFHMMTYYRDGYIIRDENGNQRPARSGRYINKKHTLKRITIKYSRENGGGWEHIFSCTCGWKTKPGAFHHNNYPAMEHYERVKARSWRLDRGDKKEVEKVKRAGRRLKSAHNCLKVALGELERRRETIVNALDARERKEAKCRAT